MNMSEVNIERGIEIVRSYFSKITGEDEDDFVSSTGVAHISWIGFDIIEARKRRDLCDKMRNEGKYYSLQKSTDTRLNWIKGLR